MLKITEFSKLCKCSVYTLRYYDQIGILKPSIINTKSGYRFYDEKQYRQYKYIPTKNIQILLSQTNRLDDYIEIKDFQSIGFSILEIQGFSSKTDDEILHMIDKKVEQLEAKLELSIYIKEKYFGGYER